MWRRVCCARLVAKTQYALQPLDMDKPFELHSRRSTTMPALKHSLPRALRGPGNEPDEAWPGSGRHILHIMDTARYHLSSPHDYKEHISRQRFGGLLFNAHTSDCNAALIRSTDREFGPEGINAGPASQSTEKGICVCPSEPLYTWHQRQA